MFSIRDLNRLATVGVVTGAAALSLTGGCALRQTTPSAFDPKEAEPVADAATPYRHFAPVTAQFENTAVVAWHTQYPLVPRRDISDPERLLVEPVLFLANLAALPVTAIFTEPATEQQAWRTTAVEPGYTAAVPIDGPYVYQAGGAIYPNFKPGLGSNLYGFAPSTLPSQYGKQDWIRPASSDPNADSGGPRSGGVTGQSEAAESGSSIPTTPTALPDTTLDGSHPATHVPAGSGAPQFGKAQWIRPPARPTPPAPSTPPAPTTRPSLP